MDSAPPALAAGPDTTMARGLLMPRLTPATVASQLLTVPTPMPTPMLTATDTVCPEWLDTPEPLPPSWPGAPRDLARGALMPSQDISLTLTLMLPTSQSPTPPTAMDLLDTPSARVIPEL